MIPHELLTSREDPHPTLTHTTSVHSDLVVITPRLNLGEPTQRQQPLNLRHRMPHPNILRTKHHDTTRP